jgi:OTU domain-containing protein 6
VRARRAHRDDFLPFLLQDLPEGDVDLSFEQYCHGVEATAAWGGQPELRALADALRTRIDVLSATAPTVTLGEGFGGEEAALRVCYMQHAFGLGEHYNSVAPLGDAARAASDASGSDGEEGSDGEGEEGSGEGDS